MMFSIIPKDYLYITDVYLNTKMWRESRGKMKIFTNFYENVTIHGHWVSNCKIIRKKADKICPHHS